MEGLWTGEWFDVNGSPWQDCISQGQSPSTSMSKMCLMPNSSVMQGQHGIQSQPQQQLSTSPETTNIPQLMTLGKPNPTPQGEFFKCAYYVLCVAESQILFDMLHWFFSKPCSSAWIDHTCPKSSYPLSACRIIKNFSITRICHCVNGHPVLFITMRDTFTLVITMHCRFWVLMYFLF